MIVNRQPRQPGGGGEGESLSVHAYLYIRPIVKMINVSPWLCTNERFSPGPYLPGQQRIAADLLTSKKGGGGGGRAKTAIQSCCVTIKVYILRTANVVS